MNLSRTQKIVVGIFTLLPFFLAPYILYEIFHFIMNTISMSEHGDPEPEIILAGVLSFLGPIILCAITSLGLLIFYIMHCIANKAINSTERVIWILVFIFIGIISFPVYWLMRVWNEGK